MEIAVNTSILSDKNQSSFIVRFAFGGAPDSVMVFPIVGGRILGATMNFYGHRPYPSGQVQIITLFNQKTENDVRGDFLSMLGTSSSLNKITMWIDDTPIYSADYSYESIKKEDISLYNTGIPKQSSGTLGILPIGFDSTQYTIELANRTRDTCTVTYATPLATHLNNTLAPYQAITLHTFIGVNSRINKDFGEEISKYLPAIVVSRRDSLGHSIIAYSRDASQNQPTRRSEWAYRFDLFPSGIRGNTSLPTATYTYYIQ